MKVLIHADGGPSIGLGHLARCSALANAFSRRGHHPVIAVDPSLGLAEFVEKLGAIAIPCEAQAAQLRQVSLDFGADTVVLDSYRLTTIDFRTMQGPWSLVAFDDTAARKMPVDAVINGSPSAISMKYDTERHTLLWLGLNYQVVRDDFRIIPERREFSVVKRVIVMVGGDDCLNLLPRLARNLEAISNASLQPFKIDLVCGPFTQLSNLSELSHVDVVRNPYDLKERMILADVAISAAGQTLYELARCGTPIIAFCSGQDQIHNLSSLTVAGFALSAGDGTQPRCMIEIGAALTLLANDPARRAEMSRKGQTLIDGLGADRLVEAIELLTLYRSSINSNKRVNH